MLACTARIEEQRLFVARLLNESKRTAEANEALYHFANVWRSYGIKKNMHADEPVIVAVVAHNHIPPAITRVTSNC